MDSQNKIYILEMVSNAANSMNIDFMLVGAYARDIFLADTPVAASAQMTYDVDVACRVNNWEEYTALRNRLIDEYGFKPAKRYKQRLMSPRNVPLDMIPFGEIENQEGEIIWPPDFDENMSVIGFNTAYSSANTTVVGTTEIKIINPQLFALLKLVSYIQTPTRTKDLTDFYYIADQYIDIIDANERLYKPDAIDSDILDSDDFDYTIAGAELIGRDCSRVDEELAKRLISSIKKSNSEDQISIVFAKTCNIDGGFSQRILNALSNGVMNG